jgi:hypothetical protein
VGDAKPPLTTGLGAANTVDAQTSGTIVKDASGGVLPSLLLRSMCVQRNRRPAPWGDIVAPAAAQ